MSPNNLNVAGITSLRFVDDVSKVSRFQWISDPIFRNHEFIQRPRLKYRLPDSRVKYDIFIVRVDTTLTADMVNKEKHLNARKGPRCCTQTGNGKLRY